MHNNNNIRRDVNGVGTHNSRATLKTNPIYEELSAETPAQWANGQILLLLLLFYRLYAVHNAIIRGSGCRKKI